MPITDKHKEALVERDSYKATVSFVDAKRQRVNVDVEIDAEGVFHIIGDCGSSSGQCQDDIEPATDAQRKLLGFWNDWHLNDLHAGTEVQEAALEGFEGDFDARCETLKAAGLYEVPVPAELADTYKHATYKYGEGWLKRELPTNFRHELEATVAALREERKAKADDPKVANLGEPEAIGTILDVCGVSNDDADLILALAKMFGLRVSELTDIDVSDRPRVTVQGIDYLAGTDEEMEKEWDASLDSYLDDCVLPELPENAQKYFDHEKWKEDARGDGRAHSLSPYDGSEQTAEVNGTVFYAYRQ